MTFTEYVKHWKVFQPVVANPDKIWYATPKQTIDPIGKTISAGTKDTIMWLLEMNWKEEYKRANVLVS